MTVTKELGKDKFFKGLELPSFERTLNGVIKEVVFAT